MEIATREWNFFAESDEKSQRQQRISTQFSHTGSEQARDEEERIADDEEERCARVEEEDGSAREASGAVARGAAQSTQAAPRAWRR